MDYDGKLSISLSYSRVKYNKMCDSQQSVHYVQTNDLKSFILINEGASLTLLVFVKS